jgi:hypothetical protein
MHKIYPAITFPKGVDRGDVIAPDPKFTINRGNLIAGEFETA